MKKILFTIVSFAALVACTTEKQMPTAIGLEPSSLAFSAQGGTLGTQVITNAETWSAAMDGTPEWCSLASSSAAVSVTAQPNTSIEARSASATVTTCDGKSIVLSIVQSGVAQVLAADKNLVILTPDGTGTQTVKVESNIGDWTVEPGDKKAADWFTVAKADDKSGFTVTAKSANDTGKKREARLVVKEAEKKYGLTFEVTVRQHPNVSAD